MHLVRRPRPISARVLPVTCCVSGIVPPARLQARNSAPVYHHCHPKPGRLRRPFA
jgi:hypothetical protein